MIHNSGVIKIIVRPNSPKNEIIGYDENRKAYKVNIKAKPEDNSANRELIKFLSKKLDKRVSILSGLKNREKLIRIDQKD